MTKIDLKTGFNLIRIKKGYKWLTAFRCKYGLFEWTVMPIGLINAPATFQSIINHLFMDLIDSGLLVYLDDLLIYAETEEQYDDLVREVFQRLSDNHLAVAPRKCVWGVQKVEFLGHVIGPDGIAITKNKVQAILDWQNPRTLRDCQSFVGFANFYKRFIRGFSTIIKPLTTANALPKHLWLWTDDMQAAFEALKAAFTSPPILQYFNPKIPAQIETDASDFAFGAVLSQRDPVTKKLHLIAFHSQKMFSAEINYKIYDKELLAVVNSFARWRHYLEGAKHQIEVFTDHRNLEYFLTARVFNRKQAR